MSQWLMLSTSFTTKQHTALKCLEAGVNNIMMATTFDALADPTHNSLCHSSHKMHQQNDNTRRATVSSAGRHSRRGMRPSNSTCISRLLQSRPSENAACSQPPHITLRGLRGPSLHIPAQCWLQSKRQQARHAMGDWPLAACGSLWQHVHLDS
jgi:hypothetical protein